MAEIRLTLSERSKKLLDRRQAELSAVAKRPLTQEQAIVELLNHECPSTDPDARDGGRD